MDKTQFSAPVLVNEANDTTILERISFGSGSAAFSYDEAWLQNLLFANPNSLPVEEIDKAYSNLVPICRELYTPAGPLDVLYATPQGKLVLLEAKLWRNPEARRKVIGQILDYAKELNRWDYEELQKQVSRNLDKRGNALFDLVKKQYPDIDESEFVDEVSRSLQTGRFMLLIVGDGIREGVGAIAKFLDDVGQLQFTLGLIEVGIYEMPNREVLVQPRVLAKTAIVSRTVVELASPEIVVRDQDNVAAKDEAEQEDNFYSTFWKEFLDELVLDDPAQKMANPARAQNIYFSMPPSGSVAWVSAFFRGSKNDVGVYLRFTNSEIGGLAFKELESQKDEINAELPAGVEWHSDDGYWISNKMPVSDVWADSSREKIKSFFAENLNIFINVFRARLATIAKDLSAE